MAVSKDHLALRDAVNTPLQQVAAWRITAQLSTKYFGQNIGGFVSRATPNGRSTVPAALYWRNQGAVGAPFPLHTSVYRRLPSALIRPVLAEPSEGE